MDAVYERRLRLVYDALDAANWKAAAKAAAAALAKHPGDAQLTALRSLALQRLGQEGEAVQLALSALAARPPDPHSMDIATRVLAAAGRRPDAVAAWRAASDAAPVDGDVARGWFDAAAGGLDYAALAPAAARLARVDPARAWWPAAATALQAMAGGGGSPLGRDGLMRLAGGMVDRLVKGKEEGDLTREQAALVAFVRGEAEAEETATPVAASPRDALLATVAAADDAALPSAVAAVIDAHGHEPGAAAAIAGALSRALPPSTAAALADAARAAAGDDPARAVAAEAVAAAVGQVVEAGAVLALAGKPGVAAALAACDAAVAAARAGDGGSPAALLPALLLADAAVSLDGRDPTARLAAAALAGVLGDAASAAAHGAALALKHVLLDTVAAHAILPYLASAGDARASAGLAAATLTFHATAAGEVGASLAAAFDAGSYGVALALARFAATLRSSRAHAAAAVAGAAAKVQAGAEGGGGGLRGAAAGAAADLARAGWGALADGASDVGPALTWTDDLAVRPAWLPPAACDDGVAAAAWWEADDTSSPPWWRAPGAASSDAPPAAAWRGACTASLRRRGCVAGLAVAAADGDAQHVARVVASVWGGDEGEPAPPSSSPLSCLPYAAAAAFWRAMAAVTAAGGGGDADADAAATRALATAATALSSACDAAATALARRDPVTGLLTRGAWAPAVSLARQVSVVGAVVAAWGPKAKPSSSSSLRPAIAHLTAAARAAAARLSGAAAPPPPDAAARAAGGIDAAVVDWCRAAGLDVDGRLQRLVAGQTAACGAVGAAARAAEAALKKCV